MITLEELTQLTAFADCGTLSGAAEALHVSQPTITRAMQSLEESFGVSLFNRSKNKISINDTGMQAVEHARKILADTDHMVREVRAYDKALRTITLESCAPAPVWHLIPALNQRFPAMTISSGITDIPKIISHVKDGSSDFGVVLTPCHEAGLSCRPFLEEDLRVCLPADHPLLEYSPESLSFSEINGYNFLLRSELGFWDTLCREKMPSSRFLVQTDEFEFDELSKNSTLPFFRTNLSTHPDNELYGRQEIPLSDPEANVTYYLLTRSSSLYNL